MTYKPRASKYNLRNSEYGGSSGQILSSGGQIPGGGEIYALPTPPPTPVKKGKIKIYQPLETSLDEIIFS